MKDKVTILIQDSEDPSKPYIHIHTMIRGHGEQRSFRLPLELKDERKKT